MRLLAVAMLLVWGVATAQVSWVTVLVNPGKFSVELPGKHRYEQKRLQAPSGGSYAVHQYTFENNLRVFLVQSATYSWSVDVSDARARIQAEVNAAARDLNDGIWTEVKWTHLGSLVAADAIGRRDQATVRSFFTLSGPDFISLTYAGPVGTERAPEVQRFITSLRPAR